MRKKAYKSLHIRLGPKHKKMLEELAKRENRTQTAVIELLIEERHAPKRPWPRHLIGNEMP